MGGDRRMEAENYLAGGYGIRLALETQKAGWKPLVEFANVWQPSRLKGIQVSPSFGTPFFAATQLFDLRPIPRKWLSLDRTDSAAERFVSPGMIAVTCSGCVGRATLAFRPHEGVLISHDLLRVEPKVASVWGWLYGFLRSHQGRAMMSAAQYGHIIKHLEVSHLNGLPFPMLRDPLLKEFGDDVQTILESRNRAYELSLEGEKRFENALGAFVQTDLGEAGFTVRASDLFSGRRRLEGFHHNPAASAVRNHFKAAGRSLERLGDHFDVWLPNRFKRIPATEGAELMDSSDLFEINPDPGRRIADGDFGDRCAGRVKAGWLMMARSGQIYGLNGSVSIATAFHEGKVISDDIIRIAAKESGGIRSGYAYVALSHPIFGRPLVKALIYGSSIPHVDVSDLAEFQMVRLSKHEEKAVADLADEASACFAKADILENRLATRAGSLLDAFVSGDLTSFTL